MKQLILIQFLHIGEIAIASCLIGHQTSWHWGLASGLLAHALMPRIQ